MKILIVNTSDTQGGAARAAHRQHEALLSEGINSIMLVLNKKSELASIKEVPTTKFNRLIMQVKGKISRLLVDKKYPHKKTTFFSPAYISNRNTILAINSIGADIVHLHWVGHNMLSIEDLQQISAPIVWTLHDNWLFTGGCHVKWDCQKFRERCCACPNLGSSQESDLSSVVWKRKNKVFKTLQKLKIVGVSQWLSNESKSSGLLKSIGTITIPNAINTKKFCVAANKNEQRNFWQLPRDKQIVLFGADNAQGDMNKGFDLLIEALKYISTKNIELVIFGSKKGSCGFSSFNTHFTGPIYDDSKLASLYSACDVMVVPSRQEAFGQTASEAMSCGVPVVAFGATGLLDIVDHKVNGYLAIPYDTADLARGIDWVLAYSEPEKLSKNARDKIVREFDYSVVAPKYIALYRSMCSEK